MTKSFGAIKGNLRLAARYLGSIECQESPKYQALKKELDDVNFMITSNPDIAKKKEDLQAAIKELKKEIKLESDEERKEEKSLELEALNDELATLSVTAEAVKNEFKERKAAIIEEMDGFLKTWYNRADKLVKLYDELGGNLPDIAYLSSEEVEIMELAEKLDGVFTGYGQHAAGTIISGDDLTDIIPLMWNEKKGSMETQCTMAQAESMGLLKMDFLGLKNLDIITEIIRFPTKKSDIDGRLQNYEERDKILKDSAIYKDIFCTGLTQGVFQFESPGMKKMLMEFQPESFEDIILLVAAYRPGPIDYIPEIIASKWHDVDPKGYPAPQKSISLKNDTLESILESTYGCPIYQEQIMQIFQNMAGYSLGGADIVRRYMSKKKRDKLAKEKEAFIYGDEERGIPGCMKLQGLTEKEADDLFEQMMPFAEYGFNKSHATAYAMVALFTAYLKKYHTADFFRSSLNATEKLTDIPAFVSEMPAFGLEFKQPTMQESKNAFTVEDDGKAIRFGLKYIKGFSEQNVQRNTNMQEFIESNPGISLKTVEKYAQLGMFKECWRPDTETGRVRGNRHECLRWLKENGKNLVKFLERVEKIDELKLAKAHAEIKLSHASSPEEEELLKKELNKISNSLSQWTEKKKEIAIVLNNNYKIDRANGCVPKETPEEILENRRWELEYLSLPFDIESSMRALKKCKNTKTFDALKISVDDNMGSQLVKVPAVVLSVSDAKKTKNGNTYYDVMLMDRNKSIITRRFDTKPNVLEGEFALMIDSCKYYMCSMKKYSHIQDIQSKRNSYIPFGASSHDKAHAIKNGGKLDNISVSGRKTVSTVLVRSSDELEPGERE